PLRGLTMKTLITSILVLGTLVSGVAQADTKEDIAALTRICEAVRTNNNLEFRREVANYYGIGIPKHQGLRLIARDLRCHGMNPMDYALQNRAMEVAATIAERTGQELSEGQL